MKYQELQARAKELGLKYVGVSAEELEKAIAEAEAKESPKEKEVSKTAKAPKAENRDAVIYNGRHRVRAYTLEQHGENYIELAEQFISHPDREGYEVRLEEVTTRITCPHCGQKFRHL